MNGNYVEWPDFARGFEPRGFGSARTGMRLCGVCAEVVSSSGLFVGSVGRSSINSARTPCLQ